MKKLIFCFGLFTFLAVSCLAQQTLVPVGGTTETSDFSISWALGGWVESAASNELGLSVGSIQPSVLIIPLSAGKEATAVSFLIYPNPTTRDVIVEMDQSTDAYQYQLITQKGQQLQRGVLKAGERSVSISLDTYQSGIYHLILTASGGQETHRFKIVKNH